MFVELLFQLMVQGAEFDGMLKDLSDMSRGFVFCRNREVILIFVGFAQTDVMALISKLINFPMLHGTLICQTENSDSCNQNEIAFKSALDWRKKGLPNSCLLPGSSVSLPLSFFSTPAKASSLTFMLEICREVTKKKEKKPASQLIPPSYFTPLYATGYHVFGKTVEKHTPAHF